MHRLFLTIGLSLYLTVFVPAQPMRLDVNGELVLQNVKDEMKERNHYKNTPGSDFRDTVLSGFDEMSDFEEDVNQLDDDIYSSSTRHGDGVDNFNNKTSSETPEYMLELYNTLSKERMNLRNSNTIRSFNNIPQNSSEEAYYIEHHGTRIHSLMFDIAALERREHLNSAELRLFTLIKRDQKSFSGVSRLVSIFQVIKIPGGHREQKIYITSKYVHSNENAWESFDVTDALKRSVKNFSRKERLEVRIQSLFTNPHRDNLDINADTKDKRQPLLVVYSNDISQRHAVESDTHELIVHELASSAATNHKLTTPLGDDDDDMFDLGLHRRSKRSRGFHRNSACRRRPLRVNFADINFDSWIIAPRSYEAYQCAGRCYFPFNIHMAPSNHAIIQYFLKQRYPKRVTRVCCVPTKLEPIALLYYDSNNVVTYKYQYHDMVVAECGCR